MYADRRQPGAAGASYTQALIKFQYQRITGDMRLDKDAWQGRTPNFN